jgi:nitrate/TMAO reductase-like tetraheme cytochrome c subunit
MTQRRVSADSRRDAAPVPAHRRPQALARARLAAFAAILLFSPPGPCSAIGVIGTQVMVHATGTDAFYGGACHSMQWVAKEHRESTHGATRAGMGATCRGCHLFSADVLAKQREVARTVHAPVLES